MSKDILKEINLLIKTLQAIKDTNIEELDFNGEAALVRHFAVVGGIAKEMSRYGIKQVKNDIIWKAAIRTRDKISHSYFSLNIEPLINAIKDIDHLLNSAKEVKESFK